MELTSQVEYKDEQLINAGTWNKVSNDEQPEIETKKLKKELRKKPKKLGEKTSTRRERDAKSMDI